MSKYIPAWDCFSGYARPDFKKVAGSGIRAVWHQCAQGNEPRRDDVRFHENTDNARAAGIAVGAYFFPYPLPTKTQGDGRSPIEQADRFAVVSGLLGCQTGELSPMVDAEWPPPNEWAKWGCTAKQLSEWYREFCEVVTIRFGRLPIIYTYPWFWKSLVDGGADVSWAARYPLWIAHYLHPGPGVPTDGKRPAALAPWGEDWSVWQYSADGSEERVPGCVACPVDRDVIRDEDTFRRLTGRPLHDPDADTKPVPVPSMRPDPTKAPGYSNLDYDPDAPDAA